MTQPDEELGPVDAARKELNAAIWQMCSDASSVGVVFGRRVNDAIAAFKLAVIEESAEAIAKGIRAAVVVRLIAGETDQKYTPTEVSEFVSDAVDEQVLRGLPWKRPA